MSTIERITRIDANGSKWMGQAPDTLEQLYDVLRNYALDPTFEDYGDFCFWAPAEGEQPALIRFWGNFYELSHVFQVDTNDPRVIETLSELIQQNKSTPAYAAAKQERRREKERKAKEEAEADRLFRRRGWRA